jgi:hypothetical protein
LAGKSIQFSGVILGGQDTPSVKESELQKYFEAFENSLHSFVGNFFTGIGELDAILQETNE